MQKNWKRATFLFLETSSRADVWGYRFDLFMVFLIVANVAAIILETVAAINARMGAFFFWFEVVSVAIFTVEYLIRVWSATESGVKAYQSPFWGRVRYVLSPLAVIDLLAFLPFYLSAFFGVDLRILRVFRLFRLLKLTRYSPALSVIWAVMRSQQRALTAALLIMVIALLLSASILFVLEHEIQPEAFASIPHAMWWALATLTTVGYGDVTPVTALGRIFGAVTMILGIGMFALPTGVVATGFANEIRKRDFVVNWKLVSGVPLFQGLDAAQIAEIVSRLTPLVIPPHHAVVRLGEDADSMFFVVSGKLEVEVPPNPFYLEEGDFFGEMGILQNSKRVASVVSLTECQLLELRADDFKQLLEIHEPIRTALDAVIEDRKLKYAVSNPQEKV